MSHQDDFNTDKERDDEITPPTPFNNKSPIEPELPTPQVPVGHTADDQVTPPAATPPATPDEEPLSLVDQPSEDQTDESPDAYASSDPYQQADEADEYNDEDEAEDEDELKFADEVDDADGEPVWYYVQHEEQNGPAPYDHVKLLINTQQLKADDLVWRKGMDDWLPIRQVDQLRPLLPMTHGYHAPESGPAGYGSYDRPTGYGMGGRQRVGASYEGKAITGFILSLVFFFLCGLLSLIGAVICKNAMDGMDRTRNDSGRGLAVAGYWIGIISCILWLLSFFCGLCGGLSGA